MTETQPSRRRDGQVSQERIFQAALMLFRKQGYDATTMRDIAGQAGMSLGSTYHYFESKSAIVMAFYRRHNAEYEEAVLRRMKKPPNLKGRLELLVSLKLKLLRRDRKMLRALVRSMVDWQDPLFLFAGQSQAIIAKHLALISWVLFAGDSTRKKSTAPEPSDAQRGIAMGIWGTQMLLLFLYVNDNSRAQRRTLTLVASVLPLIANVLPLVQSAVLSSMTQPLLAALREAKLTAVFEGTEFTTEFESLCLRATAGAAA